ncbi:MAG TPA: hypothetical protein VJ953_13270 [Saprospiraceae bacterium]|nr:hypothetical protein [Saprospiraceae bacterium]
MSRLPVLYFSFANQADRHLSNLDEELKGIKAILRNKDAREKINMVREGNTQLTDILGDLPHYREALVLFHYAGHASGTKLEFDGQGAHARSLADYFRDYSKLKFVFLNGCSTREQVEGLLAAGVQAVIATSVEINDRRAKDFALEFYRVFELGYDLQSAYNHAVQSILLPGEHRVEAQPIDQLDLVKVSLTEEQEEAPVAREYRIIRQPVAVRGQGIPQLPGTMPWGLFYREDRILTWKLQDDFPKEEAVDLQALQLAHKEKKQKGMQEELEAIDQSVQQLIRQLQQLGPQDPQTETLQKGLSLAQFQRAKKERDLFLLEKKISELKKGEAAKWRSVINRINYKDQIEYFSQWKHHQQVGAFLIQGTPKCGHSFLVQEVAPKEVLHFTRDRFRESWVYFEDLNHNNSYTPEAIWQNLRMALQMRPPRQALSQKVAGEIADILQKQHLIILFDGVNHLAAEAIGAFWWELQEKLKPEAADLEYAYPNRLILILLDREAELAPQDGDHHWKTLSFPKFQEAFQKITAPEQAPKIMQPIVPLTVADLQAWLLDSELPENFNLNDIDWDHLITESQGYVLPMIRAFCTQIGRPELYTDYYDQFDFSYV